MAALLWTVVSALLLSQEVQADFETTLANIVNVLFTAYQPETRTDKGEPPIFALAVSVPHKTDHGFDVSLVTEDDKPADVKSKLDNCEVYMGKRVIGATVLKGISAPHRCPGTAIPDDWTFVRGLFPGANTWGDVKRMFTDEKYEQLEKSGEAVAHAEYRVLKSFEHLIDSGEVNKRTDLLVFYTYKSPCYDRCTNDLHRLGIVGRMSSVNIEIISNWSHHVLVFSKLFTPPNTSATEPNSNLRSRRINALSILGNKIEGLRNIYRYNIEEGSCYRCERKVRKGVTEPVDVCVSD